MATRRHKSARKGKARQRAKKVQGDAQRSRLLSPTKPGNQSGHRPGRLGLSHSSKKKRPKPRPAPKKKRTPPKPRPAPKKPPKTRPKQRPAPKKKRTPPKPRVPKAKAPKPAKPSKAFQKVRASALRGKKFPKPAHPKRRGKSPLRGVDGQERSISVKDLWENLREGWIEEEAHRIFQRLFALFTAMRPTMYARFTFMVRGVKTEFKLGSPPLIHANAGTVRAWFTRTPVSYSVEGVMHYFRQTWDAIDREIKAAERDNPAAVFFLEYITCISYVNLAGA